MQLCGNLDLMEFAEIEIIKYLSGLAADQLQDQFTIFYCFVQHILIYNFLYKIYHEQLFCSRSNQESDRTTELVWTIRSVMSSNQKHLHLGDSAEKTRMK